MKIIEAILNHLNHSGITAASYIRAKHIELADTIGDRYKIYLDTCYWIHFRDVVLGRNTNPSITSLYYKIRDAVTTQRVICPLSQEIFMEVFTQNDPKTLEATVTVIDDLSKSICLLEFMQRMSVEAYHYVVEKTKGKGSVYNLNQLMWTKSGYVLGHGTLHVPGLSAEFSLAIEKAFFDQMWLVTLGDIFKELGNRPDWRQEANIVDNMNEGKIKHQNDFNSFKDIFLIELRGILDTLEPAFSDIMENIYLKKTGKQITDVECENDTSGRMMANLIYQAFLLNKIKNELPTLRVHTALHAALRWNRTKKYEKNDLSDLRHAAMALPYCNLFLTEKPLCHLINEKHLRLTEYITCRTLFDASEALEHLRGIGI